MSAHIKWIKKTIKGQGTATDYVTHRLAKMTGQTRTTGQKDYVAHRMAKMTGQTSATGQKDYVVHRN